jgi:hypothetical protein
MELTVCQTSSGHSRWRKRILTGMRLQEAFGADKKKSPHQPAQEADGGTDRAKTLDGGR